MITNYTLNEQELLQIKNKINWVERELVKDTPDLEMIKLEMRLLLQKFE